MSRSDRTQRDKKWAAQIRAGDRAAFKALFCAYAEPLCVFAEAHTRSPEEAEELVQDLFFKIWRDRADWTPSVSVKSYLYTAVRNLALNYLRHENVVAALKREALSSGAISPEGPDESLDRRQLRLAVEKAVEALPNQCRNVFLLSRQHGLTYGEISTVLDISIKTVETHMRRAFEQLRTQLAPLRPEETTARSMR